MPRASLPLALLLLITPGPTAAQNQRLEITRLADGVYAAIYSEYRMDPIEGNSLIVVQRDGVVVLDSGRTPEAARAMIAEIRKLTQRPVRVVINSHWHDDHIYGNSAYADAFPGVAFVAHPNTRDDMETQSVPGLKDYGVEYWTKLADGVDARLAKGTTASGAALTDAQQRRLREQSETLRRFITHIPELRVVKPTLMPRDTLVLHDDTHEIRVIHPGRGNTRGDLVVYLPHQRILATGDLLVYPVPFAYGSAIAEWTDVLKNLRGLGASAIVPGHGLVMRDTAYLDTVVGLFESLMTQVRAAAARGATLEDVKKAVDLESFRTAMAGDDPVRNGMFADSILRAALEQVYEAETAAKKN